MEVEMGVCGVYVHRHCEGAVIVDTATADTHTLTLTSQNTSSACAGEATESSTTINGCTKLHHTLLVHFLYHQMPAINIFMCS